METKKQSDWEIEFTEEELESIEAAFQSASRKGVSDIENCRNTRRRRLPDSLFNSSSSAFLPCPRNRLNNNHPYRSSNYHGNLFDS